MWMVSRNIGPWEYSDFKSDLNWGKIWEMVACKIIHVRLFHSKVCLFEKKNFQERYEKRGPFFYGLKSHNSVLFFPLFIIFMGSCFFLHKSFIDKDHTSQPQECDLVCWHGLGIISKLSGEMTIDFSSCQKAGKPRVEWPGKPDHANEEIIIATHWVPRALA